MIGNARLKLNNVRATTTNILGKLSTPPYNCDGKDRCCQLIINSAQRITWKEVKSIEELGYRDWETDRKSTRLNSSHSAKSRMPSSA